jgi:hypothetical protein
MSKTAIAQKHERDREEWQKRGISGTITAINPASKEVTVNMRSREGSKPVTVVAAENVSFLRYAPDSVRFSDARPGSFSELKVGDQVRALGEKLDDGARFKPEILVSGSFVMAGGAVTSVNPATSEIVIQNLATKKPLTIVVNKDSVLRKIPPQLAMMLAMRAQGGRPGGAEGRVAEVGGQRSAEGGGPPARGETYPRGVSSPSVAEGKGGPGAAQGGPGMGPRGSGAGGPGGEGRARMGSGDINEMIEHLPALKVEELKPGDVILVSSTIGADPSRVTAIVLASGVEPLLTQPQGPQAPGATLGLPSGVLDVGIGLP